MLKQDQFYRKFVVRRRSDMQKVGRLDAMEEMPAASVLHTVDNFNKAANYSLVPDLENPLMKLPPERKRIHVAFHDPQDDDLFHPEDSKIRFVTHGVREALVNFRKSNSRLVKFTSLEKLPDIPSVQAAVCYNTLFNVRITGRFKQYRLFEMLMANILNNVVRLKERHHILHFEMPSQEFSRSDFIRALKEMDWRKMAYPNSMNYLLMLHLVSFLDQETEISFFDKLPDSVLSNITIALTHNGKVVFYNLFTLRELGYDASGLDLALIAQHNQLVEDAEVETGGGEQVSTDVAMAPSQYTQRLETTYNDILENGKITADEDTLNLLKEANALYNTEELSSAIYKASQGSEVKLTDSLKASLGGALEERKKNPPKNSPRFRGVPAVTESEAGVRQYEDLNEREQAAIDRIDSDDSLSTAQKNRAKNAVKAYRDLTFTDGDGNEVSLSGLLIQGPENSVDENHLDFLEGQIMDESMLDSTISDLDSQYLEKQFQRDMARVIMSFPDMHPIDVKVQRTDDAVNRLDTYTVTYEDENQQRHTVKFTIPVPDENGICRINGIEKRMKKQRINNPICKVSPTRVSLNSNYNKTMVERYQANAYSFYPRIAKMLTKGDFSTERISCWPIEEGPFIDFPEDEQKNLQTRYDNGQRIFTIRVDEEYERWSGDLKSSHFQSPMGTLQLMNQTELKDITKYQHYEELRKEAPQRAESLKQYDQLVVLEFIPQPIPVTLPYEYTTLAKKLKKIEKDDLHLTFCYFSRFDDLKPALIDNAREYEASFGTFIGTVLNRTTGCFMAVDSRVAVIDLNSGEQVYTTYIIDLITEYGDQEHKPLSEWVALKILNSMVPVGLALCYRFGLKHMLDYLNVDYQIGESGSQDVDKPRSSSVHLKFRDQQILIPEPTFIQKTIFSGLNIYKLNDYYVEDLEGPDAYYDLMESKGLSPNYLKGIDNFFQLFVDPLTEDVLRQMGEPTNFKDLLIRAVALLMSEDHNPPSSTDNTHFRTYNRLAAETYNELARGYSTYKTGSIGATDKFSINPEAVFQKVVGDQLMDNVDIINPFQEFRDRSNVSHMGAGGRSADTFTVKDRQFTEDSIGVMSEATTDDGKVGINAGTSYNPNIQTLSGLANGVPPDSVTPAQLLSVTGVGIAGTTNDD